MNIFADLSPQRGKKDRNKLHLAHSAKCSELSVKMLLHSAAGHHATGR
jgi:hypothetical protein